MAILKSIPTPYGIDADYWRILQAYLDFGALSAKLVVGGYLNAQARNDGAAPLAVREYSTSFSVDDAELTREILYGFLATQPDFEGGEAV